MTILQASSHHGSEFQHFRCVIFAARSQGSPTTGCYINFVSGPIIWMFSICPPQYINGATSTITKAPPGFEHSFVMVVIFDSFKNGTCLHVVFLVPTLNERRKSSYVRCEEKKTETKVYLSSFHFCFCSVLLQLLHGWQSK